MASTYSDLKIQLMQTGENSGTWGNVTNFNLTAVEEAIAESADVTFASADVDLTLTNSNSSQTARNFRLNLTGTSGGARNLYFASGANIEKPYVIRNTLADAVTVRNKIGGTPSGSTVTVPSNKTMFIYNTGTNIVDAVTHLTSLTLDSALPVTSGGTGSSTATFSGANITSLNADNVSAGTLAVTRGGTGQNSYSNGQLLIGNSSGGLSKATMTAGNNITITNGNGAIEISAAGGGGGGTVQSVGVSGTPNGLTLTTSTNSAITTTGTILLGGSVNVSTIGAGVLAVSHGGTGSSSLSSAGIATTSGSNTFSGSTTFSAVVNVNNGIVSTAYNFTATNESIFGSSGLVSISVGGSARIDVTTSEFTPDGDNNMNLGSASKRWIQVYAVNSSINTSDANSKQDIADLDDAEKRVAVRIKGLIKKFRFKDAVVEKGAGARIHVGVIAQEVRDAFTAEGLDAHRYGLFCSDTWWEREEEVEYLPTGEMRLKTVIYKTPTEGAREVTRLGVRYDELFAFVIASL